MSEWIGVVGAESKTDMDAQMPPAPGFNILPVSKGFALAVGHRIEKLQRLIAPDSVLPSDEVQTTESVKSDPSGSLLHPLLPSQAEHEAAEPAERIKVD